jgi:hypothetical protein
MNKEKNKMRYLKLYEAFRSEILGKTLAFVSPDTKNFFIEKIEAVCKTIDFPISELSDDLFQRMTFEKALDLFVDENHEVGKIKWVKFWFDKEGKYITTTGVDGSVEKRDKSVKIDDYEVIKGLDIVAIRNELKTGDKVYIKLDYADPVIATVFRYTRRSDGRERIYMIQNQHQGSEPDETSEWQVYGQYSWIIQSSDDFMDVPKLVKPKYAQEEDDGKNPYSYNFVVDTWGRLSLRKGETSETEKYLKTASFAIVLDFDALQSSTYKTKSSIEKERSDSKKDALAFMTDHEIKSKNLQRYFTEVAKNIKFSEDLSNIKSLMMKVLGGNKLFFYVFKGEVYALNTLIREIYSLIKLSKMNQDDYKDVIKTTIDGIERTVKETYERTQKTNTEKDKLIFDLKKYIEKQRSSSKDKVGIILEILNNFEKLVEEFSNTFRKLEIKNLDDTEVIYYKLLSVSRLANESQRFLILRQNLNAIIQVNDASWFGNALLTRDIEDLRELNQQMIGFRPLALKLLQ